MSREFIGSDYCLEEFVLARTQNVILRRQRLIIVMLESTDFLSEMRGESIPDDNMTAMVPVPVAPPLPLNIKTTMLKDFIANHTYIDWRSDTWKDQLLYAMPISRLGLHNSDTAAVHRNNISRPSSRTEWTPHDTDDERCPLIS